jgi:phosphoglucosamine mutase
MSDVLLFGTDGVRGEANTYPMTAEMALARLGAAAGRYFRRDGSARTPGGDRQGHAPVGLHARERADGGLHLDGDERAPAGPGADAGGGLLTPSMRADVGVMISASHNPHEDNGIKFFGPDGFKLSDEAEAGDRGAAGGGVEPARPPRISAAPSGSTMAGSAMSSGSRRPFPRGLARRAEGGDRLRQRRRLPRGARGAVGAGRRGDPDRRRRPTGTTSTTGCGSTIPPRPPREGAETGADLGICLDGDADRIILIDETGQVADGDQIMALMADALGRGGAAEGRHAGGHGDVEPRAGAVPAGRKGLELERTAVGDRYVVEAMRAGGFNLGGEQSGHIVMTDYATTGDGLIAGCSSWPRWCARAARQRAARRFEPVPQLLKNVRFAAGQAPLTRR